MRLYLALLESSAPSQTRIFADIEGKLIDLRLANAAYLAQTKNNHANAYELAACHFPGTLATFLKCGALARNQLEATAAFVERTGVRNIGGPAGERIAYDIQDLRLLPPLPNPEKSIVIGFSDRSRAEAVPEGKIPTGFYKLPQTFITSGAPVVWPKFSAELDADACLALVIGKAGKKIPPEEVWDYVAGATLMIDITARDVNRREGLTTNNLLGKNFPSSTCLGPAILLTTRRDDITDSDIELALDGSRRQSFALKDCVFSVGQIIARWSMLGIKPGDWLAIGGSMALSGDRLQHPVPLKIGAMLTCSSPAFGTLSHEMIASGG